MNAPASPKHTGSQSYVTRTAPDTLRLERLLPGPVERVWSYLTDSEKRGQWLASGEMELRVGGRVEHVFDNSNLTGHDDAPPAKYAQHGSKATLHGRVTACEPPRLLAYTWGESSGTDSLVTFELSPRGEQVLMVLTHSRITDEDMVGSAAGWHTHVGILADRLHGRRPAAFWPTHTRLEAEYEDRMRGA